MSSLKLAQFIYFFSSVEVTLAAFRSQPEAWRQAIGFFQQTSNQYVHWYALTVFEVKPLSIFLAFFYYVTLTPPTV